MHEGFAYDLDFVTSFVKFKVLKIYKNPYFQKIERKNKSTIGNYIDTTYINLQVGDILGVPFAHHCTYDDSTDLTNDYWIKFHAKDTCIFFLSAFNSRLTLDNGMFKLTGDSIFVIPIESNFGPIMKINDSINKKLNEYHWINHTEFGLCYSKQGDLVLKSEAYRYDSLFSSKGNLIRVTLTNGNLEFGNTLNSRTDYFDAAGKLKNYEIRRITIKNLGKPPFKYRPQKEKTTITKYYNKYGIRIRREKEVEIMRDYRM
jgi:hypothetical protein